MKQKCIMLIVLGLSLLLLVSCEYKDESPNKLDTQKSETFMEINFLSHINSVIMNENREGKSEFDINEINSDLTLEEALDLFGTPRPSDRNSTYPLVYSWEISDVEVLYLIFERDDQKELRGKIDSGEYILPKEVVQYDEHGLRFLTDNELKVIREWIMDHTPVCAYVLKNGEKNFLFDLR